MRPTLPYQKDPYCTTIFAFISYFLTLDPLWWGFYHFDGKCYCNSHTVACYCNSHTHVFLGCNNDFRCLHRSGKWEGNLVMSRGMTHAAHDCLCYGHLWKCQSADEPAWPALCSLWSKWCNFGCRRCGKAAQGAWWCVMSLLHPRHCLIPWCVIKKPL